ncbi:MAG: hypothetical protein AAGA03_16235 [Planctomycetota bacterium]
MNAPEDKQRSDSSHETSTLDASWCYLNIPENQVGQWIEFLEVASLSATRTEAFAGLQQGLCEAGRVGRTMSESVSVAIDVSDIPEMINELLSHQTFPDALPVIESMLDSLAHPAYAE